MKATGDDMITGSVNSTESVFWTEGTFGRRATILLHATGQEMTQELIRGNVADLEIGTASLIRGQSLGFLADLPNIQRFAIHSISPLDDSPVEHLTGAQELVLQNYANNALNVERLEKLNSLTFVWRKGSESVFRRKSLRKLSIRRYPAHSLEALSDLEALEELEVLESSIKSLDGLSDLKRLVTLRIGACRGLSSISALSTLSRLRSLSIVSCRSVRSFSPLASLQNLVRLQLQDVGRIESINWISGLRKLESLGFPGDTNVEDGDLGPALRLPMLKKIAFANRRHYSHRSNHAGWADAKKF